MRHLLLFLVSVVILASCDGTSEIDKRIETMQEANMVAGPGERTLAEQYNLKISLPMPESDFLALLDRLKLRYDPFGERGMNMELPPLRHSEALDLSKMQKCYQIYGNRIDHNEMYRAYVDKNHRVVYVENAFSYPIP